jgi:hypothetical protein
MKSERLSREDARILRLETGNVCGHTCKALMLDGRVRLDDLREHVAERLPAAPRLLQRPVAPRGFRRPVWVEDVDFDIDAHVLAADAGPGEFRERVAQLMSQPLDRSRPLWSLHLVDQTDSGDSALVWRVHHCMADGVSMIRLASAVLWDCEPEHARAGSAPQRRPGLASSVAHGMLRRELGRTARMSVLDQRIGAARSVGFAAADLEALHAGGKAASPEVTLNDVVLGAVAGAVRRWLVAREAETGGIRVKVPVSLHHAGETAGAVSNVDSYFFVDLPVGEPDPVRRVLAINAETSNRKRRQDAQLIYRLPLRRAVTRWAMSSRVFTFNVSNVPGPRGPLHVSGVRVREVFSLAEVAEHHALRVSVVSAGGRLGFGLCADRDAVPEFDVLVDGLKLSLEELAVGA